MTFTFPDQYTEQLDTKVATLQGSLNTLSEQLHQPYISALPIEQFVSAKEYYRMRAEFRIWHEKGVAHYAMTDASTKKRILLETFPVASEAINAAMPPLLKAINAVECLRKKWFQVEFLATQQGELLVTLIYHKALDDEWLQAIQPIQNALNLHIIGRSRKQKIVLSQDYVTEQLSVNGKVYRYKQIEGSFTQPNAQNCEKMLSWAVKHSQGLTGDLLELYCGNGNFTLPLSANFRQVVATEISKTSIRAALDNLQDNQIDNVAIARMSSEEFTQALDKVRLFRRLAHIDLDSYAFSTVFVDPPRVGLDAATLAMVQRFEHIIYISCNPTTLIDNLATLGQSHQLRQLAVFDQFPYTNHLEVGVILRRAD